MRGDVIAIGPKVSPDRRPSGAQLARDRSRERLERDCALKAGAADGAKHRRVDD